MWLYTVLNIFAFVHDCALTMLSKSDLEKMDRDRLQVRMFERIEGLVPNSEER